MYSNLYQWRRIRKRVLVSGESKRSVVKSEGFSGTTLRKMLAFETPPGYCGRERGTPDAKTITSPRKRNRSNATAARRLWMEWLYGLERGDAKGGAVAERNTFSIRSQRCLSLPLGRSVM